MFIKNVLSPPPPPPDFGQGTALDWCNKERHTCYPVYGMTYMKEPLQLLGKSSLCGDSRFLLLLSTTFHFL